MDLSLFYFPSAIVLGALHALEPGHAKTLTAAFLIGTKGNKMDACVLGLSVAFTHSIVVVGLSVIAVLLGRETFTAEASFYLASGSSIIVILLGAWLLYRRIKQLTRKSPLQVVAHTPTPHQHHIHYHGGHGHHHGHAQMSDDEHARAHAAALPAYVQNGERPSLMQIIAFGATGGLVPCPAAISVMLLALSVSNSGMGLFLVLGFSLGLAITLVGVGLLVVTGVTQLADSGLFSRYSRFIPAVAASLVMLSGLMGLILSLKHQ